MDDIRYTLIEFINETSKKKKSVDFVPSSWISYDSQQEALVTKFMPPPYDDENSALLHSLVKCAAPAPEAWPCYPIAIRGEARVYDEALKKLKLLDRKMYAYSTDEEYTAEDRASAASKTYKEKKPESDNDEDLWNVPELVDQENNLLSTEVSASCQPKKWKPKIPTGVIELSSNKEQDKSKQQTPYVESGNDGFLKTPRSFDKTGSKVDPEPLILFNELLHVLEPQNKDFSEVNGIKTAIAKGFHSQSLQLTKISLQLEELKILLGEAKISQVSEIVDFSCPAEKYNIELPLKGLEDFEAFNYMLMENKMFCDDMMISMWQSANACIPVLQTVRDIFKKFISRDVALHCTAVKSTGKKLVLSKTKFFACVQDVVISKYKKNEKAAPVTTKDFEHAVGKVINNAKDWEGNRSIRNKKKT